MQIKLELDARIHGRELFSAVSRWRNGIKIARLKPNKIWRSVEKELLIALLLLLLALISAFSKWLRSAESANNSKSWLKTEKMSLKEMNKTWKAGYQKFSNGNILVIARDMLLLSKSHHFLKISLLFLKKCCCLNFNDNQLSATVRTTSELFSSELLNSLLCPVSASLAFYTVGNNSEFKR